MIGRVALVHRADPIRAGGRSSLSLQCSHASLESRVLIPVGLGIRVTLQLAIVAARCLRLRFAKHL